jgi:hypothetical protein
MQSPRGGTVVNVDFIARLLQYFSIIDFDNRKVSRRPLFDSRLILIIFQFGRGAAMLVRERVKHICGIHL